MGGKAHSIKVLLIQPPTHGAVRSLLPQVEEDSEGIGHKPPLGLLYVAAAAAAAAVPPEIRVVDCPAQGLDTRAVLELAAEYRPDLIGISAWTDFWFPAWDLGRRVKEALPGTFLVYGGPHVGIFPRETLEQPFVDAIVAGDGERPFARLCAMLGEGALQDGVPGLHLQRSGFRDGPQAHHVERELDLLPHPDRELLPLDRYGSVLAKGGRVSTMITSRGCPFRCVFCKLNFQKTLCHSAENVLEEFRRLAALGIGEVELYDDTFTWSRDRVEAICQGLIRERIPVRWAIRDRVSQADPDLLKLMHRAGCRRVHYGVESGVDRVLQECRKGITTAQARQAVRWAREAGLTVLTYFMFGLPGETLLDMRSTLRFALELDADYCEFSVTIPYPGTEMYRDGLAGGQIPVDFWLEFARAPVPGFQVPHLYEASVDRTGLLALQKEAVRRFYFRPSYLWRQLRSLSSPAEFRRKARMGLQLLANCRSASRAGAP